LRREPRQDFFDVLRDIVRGNEMVEVVVVIRATADGARALELSSIDDLEFTGRAPTAASRGTSIPPMVCCGTNSRANEGLSFLAMAAVAPSDTDKAGTRKRGQLARLRFISIRLLKASHAGLEAGEPV